MNELNSRHEIQKDKGKRLFQFLKEYSELRSKSVKTLDKYDEVLWFSELPEKSKYCFCIGHPSISDLEKQKQEEDSVWIEIKKPKLIDPPAIGPLLEGWVKLDALDDVNQEIPDALYKSRQIIIEQEEELRLDADGEIVPSEEYKTIYLEDHPEIVTAWGKYIKSAWLPWAAQEKEKRVVQDIYQRLFSIYQKNKKVGEAYQILIGLGLLEWKVNKHNVRRHMVTIPINIEFETARGVIKIVPAQLSRGALLEMDMLEADERPSRDIQDEVAFSLKNLSDYWTGNETHNLLKSLAHSMSPESEYLESIKRVTGSSDKLRVTYAPAIILRTRTQRGFVQFFQQVSSDIASDSEIPLGIQRLVETIDDHSSTSDTSLSEPSERFYGSSEVYFPLPANDQQKEIVDSLENRQGVLVQGPPGTGKSHTISNLICHLLASGKRVLITSHTARALQVLQKKLPEELAPLCVNVLGNDQNAMRDLEISVQGITQKKDLWDEKTSRKRIDELEAKLDASRSEKADVENDLQAIREGEVRHHPMRFGNYSGTLSQIAEQLEKEEQGLAWLPEGVNEASEPPLKDNEFSELIKLYAEFTSDVVEKINKECPDSTTLVTPAVFDEMLKGEMAAKDLKTQATRHTKSQFYQALKALSKDRQEEVSKAIGDLLTKYDAIAKHRFSWTEEVLKDVLADYDRKWKSLLSESTAFISKLKKLNPEVAEASITGLEGKERTKVISDINSLIAYFNSGKSIGSIALFRSQIVKQTEYLWQDTVLNGYKCDRVEHLEKLLVWFEGQIFLERLEGLWKGTQNVSSGSLSMKLGEFEDFCEPLEQAVNLHSDVEKLKEILTNVPDLPQPQWHQPQELREIIDVLETYNITEAYQNATSKFDKLSSELYKFSRMSQHHEICDQLMSAVKSRNSNEYNTAFQLLLDLEVRKKAYQEFIDQKNKLVSALPSFQTFLDDFENVEWSSYENTFVKAWNHTRANLWIKRLSDPNQNFVLNRRLKELEKNIGKSIAELAAEKAWAHCLGPKGLGEKERQSLMAWAKAVRKIGKGTGKYAQKHRTVAQSKMEECRSAIPAWIMPLYRVVESIRPGSDRFDVAIIDEASQSGPEALLLHALAEKIVIVGDDKQISPDNVGINREAVDQLRADLITDIPQHEFFGPDYSYFGLAEILFPGKIRLREHFRCMPEIIEFSNSNYYIEQPLIPLRQYGADRLKPVIPVYVNDGYRKGSNQNVTNIPEANAVTAQIIECLNDPQYEGKTFGVIALQGKGQAQLIEKYLLDKVGPEEMEKRELVCGDSYSFQGDERDIIFLSMVAANNERNATLSKENFQQRYNVAVSRAKDQMWLFHSITLDDVGPECQRHKLLKYCLHPVVGQGPLSEYDVPHDIRVEPFDSLFEQKVFRQISAKGYRVIPQYEIAGRKIDLMIEGMKGRLAVECDGDEWHGPDQYLNDMARQRMLERCGLTFWRVRGSEFYRSPETALDDLWVTLEKHQIYPEGHEPEEAETFSYSAQAATSSNADNVVPLIENEDVTNSEFEKDNEVYDSDSFKKETSPLEPDVEVEVEENDISDIDSIVLDDGNIQDVENSELKLTTEDKNSNSEDEISTDNANILSVVDKVHDRSTMSTGIIERVTEEIDSHDITPKTSEKDGLLPFEDEEQILEDVEVKPVVTKPAPTEKTNTPDSPASSEASSNQNEEELGKLLGQKEGKNLWLRNGRNGLFLQVGDTYKGGEHQSVPSNFHENNLSYEEALELFELPREIGKIEGSGEKVFAGISFKGAYVRKGRTFRSLHPEDNVLTVTVERAAELFGTEDTYHPDVKELGEHPEGGQVLLKKGPYGFYVEYGKLRASVKSPELANSINLAGALELIEKKKIAPKKGKNVPKKKSKKSE